MRILKLIKGARARERKEQRADERGEHGARAHGRRERGGGGRGGSAAAADTVAIGCGRGGTARGLPQAFGMAGKHLLVRAP